MWQKFVFSRFSWNFWIGLITFQIPAVICHHFYVPSSLVSFSHCLYILVEPLAVLVANITKIFQKSIQVAVEKMHFDTHIDNRNPEISNHVVYNFFVVVNSIVSKKVLKQPPQMITMQLTPLHSQSHKIFDLSFLTSQSGVHQI